MKNIISNIIGIILVGFSVYGLLYLNLETVKFTILIMIGMACFYFENNTIKSFLKKYFQSKLK
jgi:hypothetical protein